MNRRKTLRPRPEAVDLRQLREHRMVLEALANEGRPSRTVEDVRPVPDHREEQLLAEAENALMERNLKMRRELRELRKAEDQGI